LTIMIFILLTCAFSPRSSSLGYNKLGPDAGKEIAKALAVNNSVQKIEYVRPLWKYLLLLSCKAIDNNEFHVC
jgi:hypothetical protein